MARGPLQPVEPRRRALAAEELLMLAVLEQAVADLDHPCPAIRADADAYIFSYDPDYSVFSFDSVCRYFNLSPSAMRAALKKRSRQPLRRRGPRTYRRAA
jgi:hypothetical protein